MAWCLIKHRDKLHTKSGHVATLGAILVYPFVLKAWRNSSDLSRTETSFFLQL